MTPYEFVQDRYVQDRVSRILASRNALRSTKVYSRVDANRHMGYMLVYGHTWRALVRFIRVLCAPGPLA